VVVVLEVVCGCLAVVHVGSSIFYVFYSAVIVDSVVSMVGSEVLWIANVLVVLERLGTVVVAHLCLE